MSTPDARLPLAELLGSLSLGTDLGAGVGDEAALRTAMAAAHLARACGCDAAVTSDAYYAALLRYLGCSGFAHEEALVGAGDDLAMLAAFEAADASKLQEILALALAKLARDAPPLERMRALARFLLDPTAYSKLAAAHCAQATTLAAELGMSAGVTGALDQVYERWDGRGAPRRVKGAALSWPARLLHLANALEIHHRLGGRTPALEMVRARRGKQFDPEIADALLREPNPTFDALEAADGFAAFLALEPAPRRTIARASLRAVARAFARFVDLKSPFTLGHSTGVADLVERAAPKLGLDAELAERSVLAALLHDLGRASVPNGVWDKPGPLGTAERERMRLHAYHGERILRRSPLLASVADIAAGDHERLDGSGYPHARTATALAPAVRLVQAADVFHALTEERAWRKAMTREEAARVVASEVEAGKLDRAACNAVLEAAGAPADIGSKSGGHPDGLSAREVEVLIWLARGLSNRDIAKRLFVSPKTVKNHIAHIYEKTGVGTRAAAALYAVTHDLVGR